MIFFALMAYSSFAWRTYIYHKQVTIKCQQRPSSISLAGRVVSVCGWYQPSIRIVLTHQNSAPRRRASESFSPQTYGRLRGRGKLKISISYLKPPKQIRRPGKIKQLLFTHEHSHRFQKSGGAHSCELCLISGKTVNFCSSPQGLCLRGSHCRVPKS